MKLFRPAPHKASRRSGSSSDRDGFAIVVVVLVLMALLVLSTPFLLSARNADRSSSQLFERTDAQLALNDASRHARLQLSRGANAIVETAGGFETLDDTPWSDTEEEMKVDTDLDSDFYTSNNPRGVMWDVESDDVAGRIDLNSAPHTVIANLLDLASRFPKIVEDKAQEVRVSPAASFKPPFILWAAGEHMLMREGERGSFVKVERGLGVQKDGDDNVLPGPREPLRHPVGRPVFDQRAFAFPLWRIAERDEEGRSEFRPFDAPEQLAQCSEQAWITLLDPDQTGLPAFSNEELGRLAKWGTVHGGVAAGHTWQRPTRLTGNIEAGKTGTLRVADVRYFSEGSTLEITDGYNREMCLVQNIAGGGITIDRPLTNDYQAYETVVRVLARRPVNINSAPVEVLTAIYSNLSLRGRNDRLVANEVRALVEVTVASRPFTGLQDFLERVVLPSAGLEEVPPDAGFMPELLDPDRGGGPFLSSEDALAVYINALNPCDVSLDFSTMPFSFVSRDTHRLDLRATVNAKSGVERTSARREEVHRVAPQEELLKLFARQEDYDEAFRLDRESPYWMTGPRPTTRHDGKTVPPSRLWSHFGTVANKPFLPGVASEDLTADQAADPPQAQRVFAEREDPGWVQLHAHRLHDSTGDINGRSMHFDHETRDPEGRWLPDEPITFAPDNQMVQFTGANEVFARPLSLSMWIKPRALADATLFDFGGGGGTETDRVSLLFEGGDLVLRVLDGMGDHPATTIREAGEVRFGLSGGVTGGSGMPADVWHHVMIDVRGNRPDQMSLLVNGTAHGMRTPGISPLASNLSPGQGGLGVEDNTGFPDVGCIRVGNELIEVVNNGGILDAQRQTTGRLAGFGGRNARIFYPHEKPDEALNPVQSPTSPNFAAGTPVQRYGYSTRVVDGIPAGSSAALPADIGPFRVATLVGVQDSTQDDRGDPIVLSTAGGGAINIGLGLTPERVQAGIILSAAEDPLETSGDSSFMQTFSPQGGLAVLVETRVTVNPNNPDGTPEPPITGVLGGREIVRYSGWSGNVLQIVERGLALVAPEVVDGEVTGNMEEWDSGAQNWVANWNPDIVWAATNEMVVLDMKARTYVFPISVQAPGISDLSVVPAPGMAQFTEVDSAELTEWFRYDTVDASRGLLIRNGIAALERALSILADPERSADGTPTPTDPGDPPGGGGGGKFASAPSSAPANSSSGFEPKQTGSASQWSPAIGQSEIDNFEISRAVADAFQFRGVAGTHSHSHQAGTEILPVFRVFPALGSPDVGEPGRLDRIFLVNGADPTDPGFPATVHWTHRVVGPMEMTQHTWSQPDPMQLGSAADASVTINVEGTALGTYMALQERALNIVAPAQNLTNTGDARRFSRIVSFPSGEMPRTVSSVNVGQAFTGGGVPSALVDEVVFGDTKLTRLPELSGEDSRGAQAILATEMAAGASTGIQLFPQTGRIALGQAGGGEFLGSWQQDGGLLQIGTEIVCYAAIDATSGVLTLASNGRGLLGTDDEPHAAGEAVSYLEPFVVTTLAGGIGAGDSLIPVANLDGFPPEGTVLIDNELIHYTWQRASSLDMPRLSEEPGAMDGKGGGMFRGRYGTVAAGHGAGAPVIFFPIRYWDRYAPLADAPELSYFGLAETQPRAFWRSMFFDVEDVSAGGVRLGVLQRTDDRIPWDADPEAERGLSLHFENDEDENGSIPIGRQADLVEWRVFTEYLPGAFDAVANSAHGWKQTPRLNYLGARFVAPNIVLRSVQK